MLIRPRHPRRRSALHADRRALHHRFRKTIKDGNGDISSVNGMFVCSPGSHTGSNSDIKALDSNYKYHLVSKLDVTICGAKAQRQSTKAGAVGTGDSGGAVLTNTSVAREIRAAGITSAGQNAVTCPSGTVSGTCYNVLISVAIGKLLRGEGGQTS